MMPNFSIFTQVKNDLNDFYTNKVQLATLKTNNMSIRFAKREQDGYSFSQWEMISLIDLYHNSKFENGQKDKLNQTKIFMNVGKFRTEVAAKQINMHLKNFKFFPDDYADPYTAIFMQKDFDEWAEDCYFAEEKNQCVENFPKYGSIVLKKVGKELRFMPLQLLRNEQTAESLQTASYVIEEHPDMTLSEMQDMEGWDCKGIKMKFDEKCPVYERYGRVPLAWLKKFNNQKVEAGDEDISVDALVILAAKNISGSKPEGHVFFAEQIDERPYREAHWSKQHGRWLGIGEMENQIPNQVAKNIIINLLRRSMHWSGKRIFTTNLQELVGKNLVRDVTDGEVLELGTNGVFTNVDMSQKGSNTDVATFLNEFEKNSDQKAFTYEVATGESMPSGTPYRLGVVLSNAVNSHFKAKQDKLGLFFKRAIMDFLIPDFLKDMGNKERTLVMFSGQPGFEVIKKATLDFVKSEAQRITLLSGKEVDVNLITQMVSQFEGKNSLPFTIAPETYKTAKWKFKFDITGETIDLEAKLETLKTLYQSLVATGDSRAEAVLEKISSLTGENMSQFGPKAQPIPSPLQPDATGKMPALKTNGQGTPA